MHTLNRRETTARYTLIPHDGGSHLNNDDDDTDPDIILRTLEERVNDFERSYHWFMRNRKEFASFFEEMFGDEDLARDVVSPAKHAGAMFYMVAIVSGDPPLEPWRWYSTLVRDRLRGGQAGVVLFATAGPATPRAVETHLQTASPPSAS